MKNLRMNFLLIAGLILMTVSLSAFALFTNKPVKRTPSNWVFTGTSPQEIMDPEKWAHREPVTEECGISGELPCTITVEADDVQELTTYFDGKDEDDILELNPSSRKPE